MVRPSRALALAVLTVLAAPAQALAVPPTPADAVPAPEAAVVVASIERTPDGQFEVRRAAAPSAEKGRSLAARLRTRPGVVDAEVEGVLRASQVPPPDPLQSQQYGLEAIRAPQAWASGDATGQLVAVVDSGVDVNHPDLAPVLVPGYDFVRGDSVPDDEDGHGTHVAGIAGAATGNGVGVAGTALRARVLPIKVLDADGAGRTSDVAAGIRLAVDRGAKVVNLSLGGPTNSSAVANAVSDAIARGVTVVAASGNDASTAPNYPAALPGVIAVGAVDRNGQLASFSNTGSYLAVTAPGVNVLSTLPGGYGGLSGTSMATPFVAGAAALVIAARPTLTPAQVRSTLMATAADRGPAGFDTGYGSGVVDAAAARALAAGTTTTAPAPTDTLWLLRERADAGPASQSLLFGSLGTTMVCDFDGDGRDTLAVYRNGAWQVRSAPGAGEPSAVFAYGDKTMRPVCGDWDGDGKDGIGVFDGAGRWLLRQTPSPGNPELAFAYGWGAAVPVVGDWDGDGRDGIGVYDGGRWLLRRTATPGDADAAVLDYGWRGAIPVPGDWDGDGDDALGIYADGGWYLRDQLSPGAARSFAYGAAGYAPVPGDYDGVGGDGVGVTRPR